MNKVVTVALLLTILTGCVTPNPELEVLDLLEWIKSLQVAELENILDILQQGD